MNLLAHDPYLGDDFCALARRDLAKPLWATLSIGLALESLVEGFRFHNVQAIIYFLLHVQAAWLFLIRATELIRSSEPVAYGIAIISTAYIYLYDLEPNREEIVGAAITFAGSIFCLGATWSLGRCYGVLPICRGISKRYFYQFVRHPIYLSYVLMDVGIVVSYPTTRNAILFCVAISLFVLRIFYEEKLLRNFSEYNSYCGIVRYRLLPGVY